MLNFKDNIVLIIAIVTAFIILTGVTVAYGPNEEILIASWENGIKVEAWQFQDEPKNFCYQIRYYQPDTYNGAIYPVDSGAEPPYSNSNPDGFYVVNEKFVGNNSLYTQYNPWTEKLSSPTGGWKIGEWSVVLLKAGKAVDCTDNCDDCTNCCNDPYELADSYRVDVPIYVPIPEFPTIALPIAAILGIIFILQSRKRKED